MIINKFVEKNIDKNVIIQVVNEEVNILVDGFLSYAWYHIDEKTIELVTKKLKRANSIYEAYTVLNTEVC